MFFLFYKFLFFLSDFLEIQRKSFYLFLNELLSQEFLKIQPLWFCPNPIYKNFSVEHSSKGGSEGRQAPPEWGTSPEAMLSLASSDVQGARVGGYAVSNEISSIKRNNHIRPKRSEGKALGESGLSLCSILI